MDAVAIARRKKPQKAVPVQAWLRGNIERREYDQDQIDDDADRGAENAADAADHVPGQDRLPAVFKRTHQPPFFADLATDGAPGRRELLDQRVDVIADGGAKQHRDHRNQGHDQQHSDHERPGRRQPGWPFDDIGERPQQHGAEHRGEDQQQNIDKLPGEQQNHGAARNNHDFLGKGLVDWHALLPRQGDWSDERMRIMAGRRPVRRHDC